MTSLQASKRDPWVLARWCLWHCQARNWMEWRATSDIQLLQPGMDVYFVLGRGESKAVKIREKIEEVPCQMVPPCSSLASQLLAPMPTSCLPPRLSLQPILTTPQRLFAALHTRVGKIPVRAQAITHPILPSFLGTFKWDKNTTRKRKGDNKKRRQTEKE